MADKVTTVGAGVDAVVRRIASSYEVRGMLEKLTSYDAATGGSALNEVLLEYDSAGLLSKEYQEHGGTKDAETLYVQYNYDQSASSGIFTKGLRPTSLRYPNGRLVHTTYGSSGSAADALGRIAAINADDSGSPGDALSEYTYLGLGTIVTEDYPEPDVKLDYIGDGSYSGFDRFGRVVDHKWYDYGASAVRDQYTYGYDRASNRLYRENTTASGKDELYGYDAINRLMAFDRGDLNGEKTAISGTPVREEDWTLDPLGNWPSYVQKTSGTTDLDQERTHNKVNEITAITATTGTNWADPVHDRAGNMTTVSKPSSLADSLTCTYDAWNRLVEVQDGETVIGRYEYDGLNRRIKKHLDSQAPDDPDGVDTYVHYFYNRDWQILETRETTTESAEPEDLQPKHQHIWSLRYIDAPILRDENTDQDSLCDDQRLYYLGDANFNITTLIDTNGDALECYVYTPYGTATIYDGTWTNIRSRTSFANTILYTGHERDSESRLYQYRNRCYVPDLGTFISRDPIGFESGDASQYAYASANPVVATDALGLEADIIDIMDLAPVESPGCKVYKYATHSWKKSLPYHFGPLAGSVDVEFQDIAGWMQVCDVCCLSPPGKGKVVRANVRADLTVRFDAKAGWSWQDWFGGKLLSLGAQAGLVGEVKGPIQFEGEATWCPPINTCALFKLCSSNLAFKLGAYGKAWLNCGGCSYSAGIVGGGEAEVKACMDFDSCNGVFSGLRVEDFQVLSYGLGVFVTAKKTTRKKCLLGNCDPYWTPAT